MCLCVYMCARAEEIRGSVSRDHSMKQGMRRLLVAYIKDNDRETDNLDVYITNDGNGR